MRTIAGLLGAIFALLPTLVAAAPAPEEVALSELLRNPLAYEGRRVTTSGVIRQNGLSRASIHPTLSAARDDYTTAVGVNWDHGGLGSSLDGRTVRVSGIFQSGHFGELGEMPFTVTGGLATLDESVPPEPLWWLSPAFVAVFAVTAVVGGAIGFRAWSAVLSPLRIRATTARRSPFRGRRF